VYLIEEAKTDTEKIMLILAKGYYSKSSTPKASDPKAFEQSWQQIQPYKDKMSKRQQHKFHTVFKEKIPESDKQLDPKSKQEVMQKDMLEEAKNAAAANPGIWREYRKAALELFDADEPDKGLLMCDVAIAAIQDKQDLAGMLIMKAYSGKQFDRKDAVEAAWKEIQQVKDIIIDKKLKDEYNKIFAEQIKKQASEQKENREASREEKIEAVNARLRELAEKLNEKANEGTEDIAKLKSISEDVQRTLNDINRKVDEGNAKKEQEALRKAEEIKKQKQVKGFVFRMIRAA
jgi:hypothetical protein